MKKETQNLFLASDWDVTKYDQGLAMMLGRNPIRTLAGHGCVVSDARRIAFLARKRMIFHESYNVEMNHSIDTDWTVFGYPIAVVEAGVRHQQTKTT